MIQIKHLTITHKKDFKNLIEDFSFTLQDGDRCVMIGEEGDGKSTLLKWMHNPALIESYAQAEGERIFSGLSGYLPQELAAEDRELTVCEFFMKTEAFYDTDVRERNELFLHLGLPAEICYSDQLMKTLSGGERVKVQLASVLLERPSVLFLDEPSNDIDIEALVWLEGFLLTCSLPVLYISHDEMLIEHTATRVLHVEQIRRKTKSRITVYNGPYREYVEKRQAAFERQEMQADNDRRQAKIREEKLRRIEEKVQHDQNAISRQDPHGGKLLKKKMKAVKSMEHRFEREREDMTERPQEENPIFLLLNGDNTMPTGKTVCELNLPELTCGEGEYKRILCGQVDLRVRGPEKICIIGRNGTGKTTLMHVLEESLYKRHDIRICTMPQNYEEVLDFSGTPVAFLVPSGQNEDITRVRTYLGSMKFTADEMEHPIAELSGGQRAKLFFLRMSLSGANVLLLDEPTRNLSPLSGPVVREFLASFPGTIISISHDRKYIADVCERILRLGESGLSEIEKEQATGKTS